MAALKITVIDLRSLAAALSSALPVNPVQLPIVLKPIVATPPSQPVVAAPPAAAPAAPLPSLGVNLGGITYYDGQRVLMNLAQNGEWGLLQYGLSGMQPFASGQLDTAKSAVLWLGTNQWAEKILVPPEGAYGASPVRVKCVWQGKGELRPKFAFSNVVYGANNFEFDWLPANGPKAQQVSIMINRTEPTDPVRQVDCREKTASQTATFSPQFLQFLSGYKVLRFMDWQNTNRNAPATWATRTLPDSQNQSPTSGVAIEHMVTLANEADADAWFTVPWNSDDDYVRRFATYVRDNLKPGRKVYVEVGNEVWNWMFPVTSQARDEGVAENLAADPNAAMLMRYAEKSTWAFKIWTDVFKASPDRLVRVMAFGNGGTWGVDRALQFRDTKQYVDAIASAPYFGYSAFSGARANITDPTNILAFMDADIDNVLAQAAAMKTQAQGYGKRYIAYEGGQHLVNDGNPDLPAAVNRDPRMYDLYRKYLSTWKAQTGDVMVLYSSHSSFNRWGSWGLSEYPGQPISQTPKLRAARDFMATAQ